MHFAGIELDPEYTERLLQLENQLGQVRYRLTNGEPDTEEIGMADDDAYIIWVSDRLSGKPLACNLAYQLLLSIQFKAGFPLARAADPKLDWQIAFAASLNRLVLDLKATDDATGLGFDQSFFFNRRYKKIKAFAYVQAFDQPLDNLHSLWFAVDLALTLIFLSPDKINFLLSTLKGREGNSVDLALKIINLIETTGYSTPGRAFLAMAEISSLLNTWSFCSLHYGNKTITSKLQYETEYSNLRSLILG